MRKWRYGFQLLHSQHRINTQCGIRNRISWRIPFFRGGIFEFVKTKKTFEPLTRAETSLGFVESLNPSRDTDFGYEIDEEAHELFRPGRSTNGSLGRSRNHLGRHHAASHGRPDTELPVWRWWGTDWHSIGYVANTIQFFGATILCVSISSRDCSNCPFQLPICTVRSAGHTSQQWCRASIWLAREELGTVGNVLLGTSDRWRSVLCHQRSNLLFGVPEEVVQAYNFYAGLANWLLEFYWRLGLLDLWHFGSCPRDWW